MGPGARERMRAIPSVLLLLGVLVTMGTPTGGRAADIDAGRRKAEGGAACHRPRLDGQNQIPRIAAQHYEYLLNQLRGFKAQTRGELEGTMTSAARPLSDEEIEIVARYIASLP